MNAARTLLSSATLLLLSAASFAQAPFHVNRNLYNEQADAAADIRAAQVTAKRAHKHILLDFGANWCGDCQLLEYAYQQPVNADLLAQHYVIVHVDTGHVDHNVEVAKRYGVPIAHGIPALAVLDANGKVLYAEREKEFEHSSPEMITGLLQRWK